MAGLVEDFNPLEGLKKLGMNHDFKFIVDGNKEDSMLSVEVISYPTIGEYHLKFTDVTGMDSSELKWWLDYDSLIFRLDSIKLDMEKGFVSIELCEENSDMFFYLDNLKRVWRQPKEEIEVSKEDIVNNEYYRNAILGREKPSFFHSLISLFKK